MEKILFELLKEDKNLLLRKKEIIEELDKKIPPSSRRKFASLKMALENNIGEVFVNEHDKTAALLKAREILSEVGMDDSKIDSVVKIFENVIDELEEYSKEEEIQEAKLESPKVELSKLKMSKPEPSKVELSKFELPKPESPKLELPKPKSTEPEERKPKKIFMIILTVAIIVGIFFSYGSNKNKESSFSTTPPSTASVEVLKAKTDLSLNGMDLGISLAEAEKILGKASKVEYVDGYERYHYGDNFYIAVINGKVDAFVTRDPKYKTLRGLHVGSTYNEVVEQYGTDSKNMDLDDLTLYEYPFSSLTGEYGLLRFAVDKSNRVNYISIRIVEEKPKTKEEPKIDKNVEQAAIAFVNYHKAITRKDFVTAYSIMSPEQQNRMGPSLRDFSNGYSSTISSEITNLKLVSSENDFVVIEYVLDARDRTSGGTLYQQFVGEVQMVKLNGEWKIYSTKSKRIKETKER